MNTRKFVSVAALVLTAAFSLCACQRSETPAENIAESDLPELNIGVDILKPFFYIDENGDYTGIDADIATEACQRAGYEPNFVEIEWNDRDNYLQDGSVDCLWNAFSKNGREDDYRWTDTYLQSNLRAIVDNKSPDEDIDSLNIHAGMAVRAGSKIEELLLDDTSGRPSIRIYSCGTFEMAETAFVKGYIGGLGCHEIVLEDFMNNYPGQYRFLDGSLMTVDLGVAFSRSDSSEKWQKINDAIKEMKTDGTIAEIWDKYSSASETSKEVPSDAEN